MQLFQKREGSRDARWSVRIGDALQGFMYKQAEITAGSRRWRMLGYLSVLPMLGVTLLLTFSLQQVVETFLLVDGVLVLALSLIALLWGYGPALLLLVLGMLALDLLFIAPYGHVSLTRWPDVLQLLPFCLAGLTIGLLSLLRDKGWIKTRTYAHELMTTNQKLDGEAQFRERFLAMTSHELKTPVTSIRMQSQRVQRRLKKQPMTRETASLVQTLEQIDERTRILTSMIDELLELSRMQHHQIAGERDVYDMNVLCQEVVEDQRLVTSRSLQFQGATTPATVYGDKHRLAQVINNLITNAIKYSPLSSPIEITVDHDEQQVLVQVRDYGQGIEQEQLEHIFEPFYRTPEAQSSATGGLGLGLAITRQIVDLHEGRIWCTCEKGQGCTFFVALPFQSQPPTSSSSHSNPAQA
jgi:signal transduction histidine kinase